MKKGFTLVELLAVIVILAIILAIAVPNTSNIISSVKVSAVKSSAKNIESAASNYYTEKSTASAGNFNTTVFTCNGTACIAPNNDKLPVDGTVASAGKIMIDTNGKIYYLENLVISGYTCLKQSNGDFKCITGDTDQKYMLINSIEDLVTFANNVNNGKDYSDGIVYLLKNLDFNDNSSYADPNTTSFGDINRNGTVEGLKTELTTGQGFLMIGKIMTSDRAQAILSMSYDALVSLLSSINDKYNILQYYGCSTVQELASHYEQPELAAEIIGIYQMVGEYTNDDYYFVAFKGSFDGNGYSISNLYINKPDQLGVGMFFTVENANIKNLSITGNVSGRSYVGSLIGQSQSSTIQSCHANVQVTGARYIVGGLIGGSYNDIIGDTSSTSTVNGAQSAAGGLIGYDNQSTITNCSSTSTVSAISDNAGGLMGVAYKSIINGSTSTSTVSAESMVGGISGSTEDGSATGLASTSILSVSDGMVGGLFGNSYGTKITNSYATGTINGGGWNAGGLLGMLIGTMYNSYSNVNISGSFNHVGGLVGMIGCTDCDHSIIGVTNSYSTGNVNASTEAGGLIGQNAASSENTRTKYVLIKNSFSLGNVQCTGNAVGGLVGSNIMSSENVFAKGNVSGNNIGNLLGNPENSDFTLTNAYYYAGQVLTGTAITQGTSVILNNMKLASWWRDTLKLGSAFKYEDGYYPLLYKINSDGSISNELVAGQTKIAVN